jgi:hypothetical protein
VHVPGTIPYDRVRRLVLLSLFGRNFPGLYLVPVRTVRTLLEPGTSLLTYCTGTAQTRWWKHFCEHVKMPRLSLRVWVPALNALLLFLSSVPTGRYQVQVPCDLLLQGPSQDSFVTLRITLQDQTVILARMFVRIHHHSLVREDFSDCRSNVRHDIPSDVSHSCFPPFNFSVPPYF